MVDKELEAVQKEIDELHKGIYKYMDDIRPIDEAIAKSGEWEEYEQMKQADVDKAEREKIAKLLNVKSASGPFTESDVALILAMKHMARM